MNIRFITYSLVSLFIAFSVSACGGGGGGSDDSSESGDTAPSAPTIARIAEFFGEFGNLWKPKAEEKSSTAGLIVVLLGAKHTDRFDTCEIELIDGTVHALDCNDRVDWSHTPFSCVANGGREHWRAGVTCDQAALARVVCRNPTEELVLEGAGPGLGAVCSRLG